MVIAELQPSVPAQASCARARTGTSLHEMHISLRGWEASLLSCPYLSVGRSSDAPRCIHIGNWSDSECLGLNLAHRMGAIARQALLLTSKDGRYRVWCQLRRTPRCMYESPSNAACFNFCVRGFHKRYLRSFCSVVSCFGMETQI